MDTHLNLIAHLIASHHQFWFRRNRRNHGLVKIIQIQPVCHRSDQPIVVCKQIAVQSLCILGRKYTFFVEETKNHQRRLSSMQLVTWLARQVRGRYWMISHVNHILPCRLSDQAGQLIFMTWTRTWAHFLRLKILS